MRKKQRSGFFKGISSLGHGMALLGEGLGSLFGGPMRTSVRDSLERSPMKNVYGDKTGHEADAAALRSDWDAVHNDLRNAFQDVIDDHPATPRKKNVRD